MVTIAGGIVLGVFALIVIVIGIAIAANIFFGILGLLLKPLEWILELQDSDWFMSFLHRFGYLVGRGIRNLDNLVHGR